MQVKGLFKKQIKDKQLYIEQTNDMISTPSLAKKKRTYVRFAFSFLIKHPNNLLSKNYINCNELKYLILHRYTRPIVL